MEEVLRKWDAIDDEIWAKAIVMERNKRDAKVKQIMSEVCSIEQTDYIDQQ